MYKNIFLTLLIIFSFSSNLSASDDAISRYVYEFLKRINEFIEEEDFVEAERELEIFSKRYFKNEQSYERALINQLYGNFYAVQGMYDQAIKKYEAALIFRKIPFVTSLAVRKNLAQCYFQLSNYKKTIDVLEAYLDVAKKRGQLYSPRDLIMLGISYYQEGNYLKSYENIKQANQLSEDYKEDWLGYELAVAVKLEKYDDAVDIAQILLFVNPDKKEYWKQISGLYYTTNDENQSLAGLELAFEKDTLTKEKEYLDLARYYLYKELPQKAIKVINDGFDKDIVERSKENYELMADSYFFLRERDVGIEYLIKSLELEKDSNIAFKIGRFAFEEEDWFLAIKYLKEASDLNYNKVPGRLDLLIGISYYEVNKINEAEKYFNNALNYEATKTPAEGWLAFIKELNT